MYAQLLNCVQMSPEDVEGVSTALAEDILSYPDINPYSIFRRELEVKELLGNNEISDEAWCERRLPILVPPNSSSVPDDSTPSSALKSTDAYSSQPASNSIPPKPDFKTKEADSQPPPASVPEKSLPSYHKSTEDDLEVFCDTTMRGLVSEEMRVSSLNSTDDHSSLACAKVRYCFAFSSQNSSFNSSFKPASTSEALHSSSPSNPKPASVSNKSTEAYSSLASAKVCNSFATLSHNSFFTSSFKHDSTSEALTSSSPTTKPTDAESFVASAKVRYCFAFSSHNSSFTSSSLSHTTKRKPSEVTYNLNVLESDLIGQQGMTMYDQSSSNSNLFDFFEEGKVILRKPQMISYPWSYRKSIEDG